MAGQLSGAQLSMADQLSGGTASMAGQLSVVGHCGGTPVYGRSAVCGGPLCWDSDITYKHL